MSIFRIPEDKDEDCMKKTLAFLNEQLGLTFKESDIDRVHRVGRSPELTKSPSFSQYMCEMILLNVFDFVCIV